MNVADIAARVKRVFGDEAGVQITDTDIIRWINDAQLELCTQSDEMLDVKTTHVAANQAEYGLPQDMLSINNIRYNNTRLNPVTQEEFDEFLSSLIPENNPGTGIPTMYWRFNRVITLLPTPSTALLNGLKVYYTRTPAAVALTTDVPELPIEFHPRIVEYCLQQAYELDEDWTAAGNKAAQLTAGVSILKGLQTKRQQYYESITVMPEDSSYGAEGYHW